MEQRINFITKSTYAISEEDKRRFYTLMALFRHDFFRHPDYNEAKVLNRLRRDYLHFVRVMMEVCHEQPNDLMRNRLRKEVIFHYSYIKLLCKQIERENVVDGEMPQ